MITKSYPFMGNLVVCQYIEDIYQFLLHAQRNTERLNI